MGKRMQKRLLQLKQVKKPINTRAPTWGESSVFPAITLLKNINAQWQGILFVPRNIIYGRRNVQSTCKDLTEEEYRKRERERER